MTILLIFSILVFLLIIYLIIDVLRTGNFNYFLENWVRRTVWLWLPFFALWRLIKEVILHKK
jgi:hypothetical protein